MSKIDASAENAGSNAAASPLAAQTTAKFTALLVGSIGVVYGDIGTSPLYAFREAVVAAKAGGLEGRAAVLGVLSLITWALILVVTLKYVLIMLRADNNGEGGTFALMALGQKAAKRTTPLLFVLGLAGASFFYGDAVITPAISVLSAVEGLKLVSPVFNDWIIPLSLLIILALFAVQSHGTARVARLFGPITAIWFVAMAVGGIIHIADDTGIVSALSPHHGIVLVASNGLLGLTILGLVFLAVTGAEALYADLGHFGRRPIQYAWLFFVFPALLLNYFGQGALVLAHPETIESPFFRLYPEWILLPIVLLATAATVIASQAVITGAFSLTQQAVHLGLLPRLGIRHTSEEMAGQIYLPQVNWLLFAGVVFVVVLFQTSSALASAYGVAVTATMIITSVMGFFVIWRVWGWSLWATAAIIVPLLLIEQAFFTANILKVFEGGWLPLLMAAVLFVVMWTWVRGYGLLSKKIRREDTDLAWLARKLEAKPPLRVPGTAVFLSADTDLAPTCLMHNLKHNRVLHERNVILSIKTENVPRVPRHERVEIDRTDPLFTKVIAHYGFMESPNVPKIFETCKRKDFNIEINDASFFLSRRSLRIAPKSELPRWQQRLFLALAGSAEDATVYFRIPMDRAVEIGTQVAV
jgi:KUP system potassium uptake protein